MTEPALQPRGVRGVVSKLHDYHLQRLAIVYVRQSHPQQVVEHVESTARQYALVDRAVAWGWARGNRTDSENGNHAAACDF